VGDFDVIQFINDIEIPPRAIVNGSLILS